MPMLRFLRKRTSGRKLRLFACECCHQNRPFMALSGANDVVRATERWAEGRAIKREAVKAFNDLELSPAHSEFGRKYGAMQLGFCSDDAYIAVTYTTAWATDEEPATERWLANLVREVFGNPFRPVPLSPVWRTGTAVALAQQVYESRDFGAMPILADALQDAGCDNADVLDHGRGPGPHVYGCWVVDLVLGKE
ncbi:Uncharacterized protein OS=Sorangium cellulosum (strain So ce56) GN=sce5710 PE=4 SV=1 [Gemmata massiliana]|uniref:Uncharacterized protein n=1 Tax=Gemmata massiliana TaxID=1210884 RepID=A0A6P2CY19_9BACT|nr:hypothetical protein [Gemmata massiliana]VTR93437.1 Uncharacterized protein OS=Sorangium cellulosum (strain So ce56) GN=sce5710 PE=4 SV=1 [Gemmata massiliana]